MAKQTGPCAFTNSCSFPGPRLRLGGNRLFCMPHARTMSLNRFAGATDSTSAGTQSPPARLGSLHGFFAAKGVIARKG